MFLRLNHLHNVHGELEGDGGTGGRAGSRNGRTALYVCPINLTEQDGKTMQNLEGELMGVERGFNSRYRLSQTSLVMAVGI